VIAAHAPALLALPDVAGVYEGTLPGGAPCIVIAAARRSSALEDAVPGSVEGYPVAIRVTGTIVPHED
jgi:hypothetical protein